MLAISISIVIQNPRLLITPHSSVHFLFTAQTLQALQHAYQTWRNYLCLLIPTRHGTPLFMDFEISIILDGQLHRPYYACFQSLDNSNSIFGISSNCLSMVSFGTYPYDLIYEHQGFQNASSNISNTEIGVGLIKEDPETFDFSSSQSTLSPPIVKIKGIRPSRVKYCPLGIRN